LDLFVDGRGFVHICDVGEAVAEIGLQSRHTYGFFDRLALYDESLKAFFDQGRILAWGIVPTSESKDIDKETAESLLAKWDAQAARLEAMGIDPARIVAQSLITPSCGTGSLTLDQAVKVLEMTRQVSQAVRSRA